MAFTVDSIGFVLLLLLCSLLLLGGWPAVWKYCDIKGKKPVHTFLDYGVAYIFVGIIAAAVGGSLEHAGGTMPPFAEQFRADSGPLVGFAIAGGVALSVGDWGLQYAIVLIGVTLAPSICASVVNITAIVLSYIIDPINDPKYVFSGLACSVVAIVLGALTQYVHERTTGEVNHVDDKFKGEADNGMKMPELEKGQATGQADPAAAGPAPGGAAAGTEASRRTVILGLVISVVSGVLTGLFIPGLSIACTDPFKLLKPGQRPMYIYVAALALTVTVGVTAICTNAVLLYRPFPGSPSSTILEYLRDNKHRVASLGAGAMVALSNVLQVAGGQYGGYTASMLSGAFPLITTLLGVLIFREFRSAKPATSALLAATCGFYVASIVLLGLSAKPRER